MSPAPPHSSETATYATDLAGSWTTTLAALGEAPERARWCRRGRCRGRRRSPAASTAAVGNRHASARLADGAVITTSSPSTSPSARSGLRSGEADHPRQRPRDSPRTLGGACRERAFETTGPEQVSRVVVYRKHLVGWSGDRGERREDVHPRGDHTGAERHAVPRRTLERCLPLQLESRLSAFARLRRDISP